METSNIKNSIFKKIDLAIFNWVDKFKLGPNYMSIQDFYGGFEEEQQKILKAGLLLSIIIIPLFLLGLFWWQNNSLKENLKTRIELISTANQIIGEKQSLQTTSSLLLSSSPIDGASMMNSRLSQVLSDIGIDLSKIQVSNYDGTPISESMMRSQADFKFKDFSTDELMNIFSSLIKKEKFKIESLSVKRNSQSNKLEGSFHAIHFSQIQNAGEL